MVAAEQREKTFSRFSTPHRHTCCVLPLKMTTTIYLIVFGCSIDTIMRGREIWTVEMFRNLSLSLLVFVHRNTCSVPITTMAMYMCDIVTQVSCIVSPVVIRKATILLPFHKSCVGATIRHFYDLKHCPPIEHCMVRHVIHYLWHLSIQLSR